EVTVFALNRGEEEMDLECTIAGVTDVIEHLVLWDEDRYAVNSAAEPNRVVPSGDGNAQMDQGVCKAVLKPLSWNAIRLRTEN
ncbi:MAG: alpha-N-arabinofuranosidase, partial [Lachnospiraceae bacterium]|nr:alpha-N-arabinofuranosidase [Lachnospiraceae bacterium]